MTLTALITFPAYCYCQYSKKVSSEESERVYVGVTDPYYKLPESVRKAKILYKWRTGLCRTALKACKLQQERLGENG